MLLLLIANICLCRAATDAKDNKKTKICCKTLDINNDIIQYVLKGPYKDLSLKRGCYIMLGLCQDPRIKSTCAKQCASYFTKDILDICSNLHVTKEAARGNSCKGFDIPSEYQTANDVPVLYKPFLAKICQSGTEVGKVANAIGKCTTEYNRMVKICKFEKLPPGKCDKTCFDPTCAASEFCFCPGNDFKSCTKCKPGCTLRSIDANGHHDCKEENLDDLFDVLKYQNNDNDVVVVHGRNLRARRINDKYTHE